jgi:hypothetical protein
LPENLEKIKAQKLRFRHKKPRHQNVRKIKISRHKFSKTANFVQSGCIKDKCAENLALPFKIVFIVSYSCRNAQIFKLEAWRKMEPDVNCCSQWY